jgi:hypothetical protein
MPSFKGQVDPIIIYHALQTKGRTYLEWVKLGHLVADRVVDTTEVDADFASSHQPPAEYFW